MGEILQINSISTYEKKNAMDFNSAHIKRLMFSSVLNQRSWKLTTYEVWFYFTDERKVISPSASNPSDHPFPQKNLAHIVCAVCHQDSEGPTHQLYSSLATKKAKLPESAKRDSRVHVKEIPLAVSGGLRFKCIWFLAFKFTSPQVVFWVKNTTKTPFKTEYSA